VRETRGSTTTDLYFSAQWQVLEERVGSAVKVSYAWSPFYVDSMIARDRDTDANGSLDERLYAIHDVNFNIVALVDTSGNVVERYAYDAFGGFVVLTPSWGSRASSNYDWKHYHQGLKWDADLGGFDDRNRILGPAIGRFFQVDPIQFIGGDVVLYRALSNNPFNRLDPLGFSDGEVGRIPGIPTDGWGAIVRPLVPAIGIGEGFWARTDQNGKTIGSIADGDLDGAFAGEVAFWGGAFLDQLSPIGRIGVDQSGAGDTIKWADPDAYGRGRRYAPNVEAGITLLTLGIGGPRCSVPVSKPKGGIGPVLVGQAGEKAVGINGAKTKIPIPGTTRNRIPDRLTPTTLSEVKNVASLSYTKQLRDFATYARHHNLIFELWVRSTTRLSGPLQEAIRRGEIVLRIIPGT
jgi:RHS repeat-associated protein